MSKSRITELRREQGWTQEYLADTSGVSLRTIQRLEAGQDASLETLTLVAEVFHVPVKDLFLSLDGEFSTRIESLQVRANKQQAARDQITRAWFGLFVGIGIVISLIAIIDGSINLGVMIGYWTGGLMIVLALRRLALEPFLDDKYPLSRTSKRKKSRFTKDLSGTDLVATANKEDDQH